MEDIVPMIGQEMLRISDKYFTTEPLRGYALAFIREKQAESMRFGLLTMLHYRMFGGGSKQILQAAAAVELFILASDILDDLQDGDAPHQAWSQVPPAAAMQTAASLMVLSQQAILELDFGQAERLRAAQMMNDQFLKAANGQMLDLMNAVTDEDSYIAMVQLKSAALIVMACMTGVMLAGREWHPMVAEYAEEVGMAAQIKNDIRDLLRWDDKNDFILRKKTLLTLFLLEEIAEEDRWIKDYFEGRLRAEDVADRQQMLEEACDRTGAALYGSVRMRMHFNRFQELIDEVPEAASAKDKLLQIFSS
ncbi:polyprenyl synthetase family protein [Paenibacillus glycanilyticus]|uniref:polyprenyl synthetase family protein n=1 Tax=Paenibacillus glycanilyticus TaxID=126569 RepID=UPI00203DA082|nr:polyprenyl synthetase family protein [Paenibacillus glycanilyticus]MCM3630958.1 polyprenyl synthetase family protein [Paenibacillus glycanilyticus]